MTKKIREIYLWTDEYLWETYQRRVDTLEKLRAKAKTVCGLNSSESKSIPRRIKHIKAIQAEIEFRSRQLDMFPNDKERVGKTRNSFAAHRRMLGL